MDFALQLPRTVASPGAITAITNELIAMSLSRPLLVTDAGILKAGLVDRLRAVAGNISLSLFADVTENNVFADADTGAVQFQTDRCDCVIALGGGSVIDTAKCIAVLAANSGAIANYALHPEVVISAAAPIIAIPTTSGTGSEANIYAGIHPDSGSRSAGIASRHIMPRVAILDPELTVSLPPRITAATGIDALSHCIEGYLSQFDVPLAKTIALDGVGLVMRHLRRAVADGSDMEARSGMMRAAYAGGVAIAMGTGPAHAIALTCSDQNFPHGILSGIGLVATLDSVGEQQPERMSALKTALGLAEHASASEAIEALMRELGLPSSLGELGYRAGSIDEIAQLAHAHLCNTTVPRAPSLEDYQTLLTKSLAKPTF